MLASLNGKKTYLIVAIYIVLTGLEVGLGWDIPGFNPGPDWLGQIMGMLGLAALRKSVPTVAVNTILSKLK